MSQVRIQFSLRVPVQGATSAARTAREAFWADLWEKVGRSPSGWTPIGPPEYAEHELRTRFP